jgi:DNA-binding XRE family transcriptional regulator
VLNRQGFIAKLPLDPESRKTPPKGYPAKLKTVGDHLRRKRMDQGLFQREVAAKIGVDLTTYRNWEWNRTSPRTRFLPAVIEFLE